MVHRREIENREVVFGNQGDLYLNAMTWFDHDTGSVWSQPTGEAIMGPLAGARLELLPSSFATWAEWRAQFPDTLALDVTTRRPIFDVDGQAVVVMVGDDSLAVTVRDLRDARVVNETVGGQAIVAVLPAGTDRPVVWSRVVEGKVLEFALDGKVLVDRESEARFDVRRGIGNGDIHLEPVPSFGSFPADYARIWPEGRVWRPTGPIPASRFSDRSPDPGGA